MTAIPAPARSPSSEEAGRRLASLFDAHGRMVLGLCRFLLRDADEADDATQQTFLSAYRSLLGGTKPRNPGPWLAEIARRECQHRIAARMREPLPLAATVESTGDDPAEAADQTELIRELKTAIAELPDRQREAVILRDFYGLSYREVATVMTVSVPVVESLLFRARRHLGRRLGTLPRLAQGALAVPLALREELARAVPGFDAAVAGLGITGGGAAAGIIAKLAALPGTAKVATATTVAAVAVGGATVTPQAIDRHPDRPKPRSTATTPSPSPAPKAAAQTGSAQATGAATLIAEARRGGRWGNGGKAPAKARPRSVGSDERKEKDDLDEADAESESLEAPESEAEDAEPEREGGEPEREGGESEADEAENEVESEAERSGPAVTPTRSATHRGSRETESERRRTEEKPEPDEDEEGDD